MTKPRRDSVRVEQRAERQLRTYADLWHGVNTMVKLAKADELGEYWKCMSALILLAFTIEAYCNYVGPVIFTDEWNGIRPIERKPPSEKLKLIAKRLGVSINYGRRPDKVVKELFDSRDKLAHAKRGSLNATTIIEVDRSEVGKIWPSSIPAAWDAHCTVEYLDRAILEVEAVLFSIHERIKADDIGKLFIRGIQISSLTVVPEVP